MEEEVEVSNWMTVTEAANRLKVNLNWVYCLIYTHKLTAKKMSGHGRSSWMIDRKAVETYAEQSRRRRVKSITARRTNG